MSGDRAQRRRRRTPSRTNGGTCGWILVASHAQRLALGRAAPVDDLHRASAGAGAGGADNVAEGVEPPAVRAGWRRYTLLYREFFVDEAGTISSRRSSAPTRVTSPSAWSSICRPTSTARQFADGSKNPRTSTTVATHCFAPRLSRRSWV